MTPKEKNEFLNAIEALGQKQMLILANSFARKVDGTRFSSGMDLLSETMGYVLDGSRTWKRDIPLGAFLHEAMRSILSIERRRPDKRPLAYEDWMDVDRDLDTPTPYGSSPEEYLIYLETQAEAEQAIQEARNRLSRDPEAQMLLSSDALGVKAAEVRKLCGISEKAYKAARDRIARDIRSHGPRPNR